MASIRERGSTVAVLYRYEGRQTSATFTNRKDAERFKSLIDLLGPVKARAEILAEQDSGLTLDALAELFFAWKAGDVEARTIKDYRRDYANWIRPMLGGRQAEAIDERDVQALVDQMSGRGLDPKSIADRHMILGAMYRYGSARSRQLVTHNPCQETQLPKRRHKVVKGFTLAEWDAMHEWGKEHEPDADDLLLFVASCGWRFSEVTPITPAAVEDQGDLEVEVDGRVVAVPLVFVTVRGVHRRDEDDRTVYAEGKAKSSAGLRRTNLPPEAAWMVRRRLVGKGPADLLFTNAQGSQWRSNNFLRSEFPRILAGAGVPKVRGMGPHYLRHTHVAMLDRVNVSLAKMQKRIGHENISTTIGVYGGMIDNTLSPEELVRLDAMIVHPEPSGQVVQGEVVMGELG